MGSNVRDAEHGIYLDGNLFASSLTIPGALSGYAPLWLCMSSIRGEVDCGYGFRRLFLPLFFPHFSLAYMFSVNNLHCRLYFTVNLGLFAVL